MRRCPRGWGAPCLTSCFLADVYAPSVSAVSWFSLSCRGRGFHVADRGFCSHEPLAADSGGCRRNATAGRSGPGGYARGTVKFWLTPNFQTADLWKFTGDVGSLSVQLHFLLY